MKFKELFGKQEASHLKTGKWGEKIAERTLRKKGYRTLGRRIKIGKRDEIDLVMRDNDTLVFVEVKTRSNANVVRPRAAINRTKKRALSRAATHYLAKMHSRPSHFRFDAVEVIGKKGIKKPAVKHIKHAFTLDKKYQIGRAHV